MEYIVRGSKIYFLLSTITCFYFSCVGDITKYTEGYDSLLITITTVILNNSLQRCVTDRISSPTCTAGLDMEELLTTLSFLIHP